MLVDNKVPFRIVPSRLDKVMSFDQNFPFEKSEQNPTFAFVFSPQIYRFQPSLKFLIKQSLHFITFEQRDNEREEIVTMRGKLTSHGFSIFISLSVHKRTHLGEHNKYKSSNRRRDISLVRHAQRTFPLFPLSAEFSRVDFLMRYPSF